MKRLATFLVLIVLSTSFPLSADADYKGLKRIPWANPYCESGGNPYNTSNSTYRGKWQFDQWTWNRFAPKWLRGRDPAYVSEYWQDWVAVRVSYDAWPHC